MNWVCTSSRRHQGSGPSCPTNVPVGPSGPMVAIATRINTASSTVLPPARRNASRSTESMGPVNSVSVARCHRVDAPAREGPGVLDGQHVQCRFRHRVGQHRPDRVRLRIERQRPHGAADVHHDWGRAFLQQGCAGNEHPGRAHDVRCQHGLQVVGVSLRRRSLRAGESGVVHQDVKRPDLLPQVADGCANRGVVGDVDRDRARADRFGYPTATFKVPRSEVDGMAGLREAPRQLKANASRGSRDEGGSHSPEFATATPPAGTTQPWSFARQWRRLMLAVRAAP